MKMSKQFYIVLITSIVLSIALTLIVFFYMKDMDADEFALMLGVGTLCMGALDLILGLLFLAFILDKKWRIAFLWSGGIVLVLSIVLLWIGSII